LKIFIHLLLLFTFLQSREPSPIPLPKTEILSRSSYECSELCLKRYLEKGDIFSFLSYSKDILDDQELEEKRRFFQTLLNISRSIDGAFVKIALIIPDKKIHTYSLSVAKSTFAYLLAREIPFQIENYYIDDEKNTTIRDTVKKVENDGFSFVIAPFTEDGAKILADLKTELYFYIPTINAKKIESSNPHLLFGGIDYESQIDELITYLDGNDSISIFYDDSPKGEELENLVSSSLEKIGNRIKVKRSERVQKDDSNFNRFFSRRNFRNRYFLNTPRLKSALILSQMTSNNETPSVVLSTQINYSPTILSMTQFIDRKNLLIANSISSRINRDVLSTNSILQNDIKYDWINYSTTVGIDYLFSLITGQKRLFQELLIKNQIIYNIRIMKPQEARFVEVKKKN
jgi:hypothetical protein